MQELQDLIRRIGGGRDLPLAAAIVLTLAGLIEARVAAHSGVDAATAVAVTFAATVPLVLGDRYLSIAAVVVCAAMGTWLALDGTPAITILIGQLWILFRVAVAFGRPGAALALGPLAANAVYPFSNGSGQEAVVLLGLGVIAAVLGDAQRQRSRAGAELDAARGETAEARRDQAVLAERTRIARELHDVVAHHVSMMVVQAETARVGTPDLVPEAAASLESIRDTGRQALAELRRVLGVLRAEPAPGQAASRAPQPGLGQVDDLVEAARFAGVGVRLRREGDVRPLPVGVELCAYRIIQEALTNVRRHAPGATADIVLVYGDEELHFAVRDDGPGPGGGEGFGLVGMRERAALAGGRLQAGAGAGGGFEVVAEVPLSGGRR